MSDHEGHDVDHDEDGFEDLDALLGAYVVDALDDDERRRVERWVARDERARAELDRLAATVDQLAAAEVLPVDPPAELWDRIAAQLPPRAAPATHPAGPPEAEVDEVAAQRAQRPRRPGAWVAAVAAAAAVVIVVGGLGVAISRRDQPATTVAEQLQEEAARVAGQSGSRTAVLAGDDPAVEVQVVMDGQGHAFVLAADLPPVPSTHTYQLWSLVDGVPISVGLLGAQPTVAVVGAGDQATQMAITVELADGSVGPTTPPVVHGSIA